MLYFIKCLQKVKLQFGVIKLQKIGAELKFRPKFTNGISHLKRSKNAEELTNTYLANISTFGKYLGPFFLQFSDILGFQEFFFLQKYLEELPANFDVFVELRHVDWYADDAARKDVFELFRKLNKGAVITDTTGRQDIKMASAKAYEKTLPLPKFTLVYLFTK